MLNNLQKTAISMALSLLTILVTAGGTSAETFRLGAQEAETFHQAEIISAPEPVITSELKEECLNTFCIARFKIDHRARVSVELLTSSGSPEVDDITVSTLRSWKFRPALRGSEPVPSTRKIRVEFVIE